MRIIFGSRIAHYLARVSVFLITAALIAGMAGCGGDGSQNLEIQDWYDLDAVRDNLAGSHILMNDLDSTTPGYEELASPTANGGKGWEPIGSLDIEFNGAFNGQGYDIRDLFIHRPDEFNPVGIFSRLGLEGVVQNVGVVDADVTGNWGVGGLVGINEGTVSNSYSTGSVTGASRVGGLVGLNGEGAVSNSYSTGNVTGDDQVGGLVGSNYGTVSNSYSTGSVTGNYYVGGLVGWNEGTVSNSHSTGSVTGNHYGGGLVGINGWDGTVSNSHSSGNVTGDEYVGGLVGVNFGTVSNSYSSGNVTGDEYVGGLVGVNRGGTVSNSFWDTKTSRQATSAGGTGKTTAEMQDIATFLEAAWDIWAVAPGATNFAYTWNIVHEQTYPFLSWQSVV
ncbi:MAG: GLUG motif-containing protein [Dehalococcoidia bacterium]